MFRTRFAAVALAAALPLVLVTGTTSQAGNDEQIKRGNCSGSTDWKLKVKTDNGRLEVEGEVDSNVNGQTWRWALRHDGDRVARGRKVTRGPSGSFDVTRRVDDHAGTDRIKFRARNPRTDEVCVGRIRF